MSKSKMRQAIEEIAPQLQKAGNVYIDGYQVNDPETGEKTFTKYRMKWAEYGRGDMSFTPEQEKKIRQLPGVVNVNHTRNRGYESSYKGFFQGPVVTFSARPSKLM